MANLNVTFDQLTHAAAQLQQGHEELDATLTRLRSVVTELIAHGFTTTRASGAFDQASEQFTAGAKQTVSGLQSMAQFLTGAAETLRQTDEHLARSIR